MNCQLRFGRELACPRMVPTSDTYFVTGSLWYTPKVVRSFRLTCSPSARSSLSDMPENASFACFAFWALSRMLPNCADAGETLPTATNNANMRMRFIWSVPR